jgi:hypothetical protein
LQKPAENIFLEFQRLQEISVDLHEIFKILFSMDFIVFGSRRK